MKPIVKLSKWTEFKQRCPLAHIDPDFLKEFQERTGLPHRLAGKTLRVVNVYHQLVDVVVVGQEMQEPSTIHADAVVWDV